MNNKQIETWIQAGQFEQAMHILAWFFGDKRNKMNLQVMPERFSICEIEDIQAVDWQYPHTFVSQMKMYVPWFVRKRQSAKMRNKNDGAAFIWTIV